MNVPCLCTGREDVFCDGATCSIAGLGAPGNRNSCRICWLAGKRRQVVARPASATTPSFRWTCGLTTCPERRGLLRRTLTSLSTTGFTPRLFVDGDDDGASWSKELGYSVTARGNPPARVAGNWTLALAELYQREPKADRFAIFQDDLVAVRNLRGYLDTVAWPERAYLNLFTFRDNEKVIAGKRGWAEASLLSDGNGPVYHGKPQQTGRGAVALCFTRECVIDLLGHWHLWKRAEDEGMGWRKVDGGIVEVLNRQGWREYVHAPSLVQHTGDVSTIREPNRPPRPIRTARTFPGEQVDAMDFLCEQPAAKTTGLGDVVAQALSTIGVTEERVSQWIGRPCGCKERREKLNVIGQWAARVVSGKVERAKDFLDHIIGE